MSVRADYGLFKHHLSDIQSLATGNAKVILTCRSSFFKDKDELDRLHDGNQLYETLHKHKSYQVILLKSFSEIQVQEYINRYFGKNWVDVFIKLDQQKDLLSLAARPILLNLLIQSVHPTEKIEPLTQLYLYQKIIHSWVERDDWRCKLSSSQRSMISQKLAYIILTEKRANIHHEELIDILTKHFGGRNISEELINQYNHEIKLCSFLRSDLQGFYSFAHKSFAEYLLAEYIISEVCKTNYEVLDNDFSTETIEFLVALVKAESDKFISYFWDILLLKEEKLKEISKNRIRGIAMAISNRFS